MATLSEIYDELDRIGEDITAYIEECDNGNLSSDLAGNVGNPMETLLVALETIIDDKDAGVYDPREIYENPEDFE
jgi:hypothetical protein|tara:strand:+ start:52 stop:276 length:225 start_codon:yes stop_codon:yes gene_type:complete